MKYLVLNRLAGNSNNKLVVIAIIISLASYVNVHCSIVMCTVYSEQQQLNAVAMLLCPHCGQKWHLYRQHQILVISRSAGF
jgi:hypothetical protein